jgi:hypothetical protein
MASHSHRYCFESCKNEAPNAHRPKPGRSRNFGRFFPIGLPLTWGWADQRQKGPSRLFLMPLRRGPWPACTVATSNIFKAGQPLTTHPPCLPFPATQPKTNPTKQEVRKVRRRGRPMGETSSNPQFLNCWQPRPTVSVGPSPSLVAHSTVRGSKVVHTWYGRDTGLNILALSSS